MSRTLRITGNHAMYDCGARFLRVIMSMLLAVSEQGKTGLPFLNPNPMYKRIIRFGFCDIQNINKINERRCMALSLRLQLITPTSTSIINILDIT